MPRTLAALLAVLAIACDAPQYDVILRGGTIYDGTGSAPISGDVAIAGDSIVAIGDIGRASSANEIDVTGLAVAPGFINMLSWATESLIEDGRSLSDIRQGVKHTTASKDTAPRNHLNTAQSHQGPRTLVTHGPKAFSAHP